MPDLQLQLLMYRDISTTECPGTAVLLTRDGAECIDGVSFLSEIHSKGWAVEVLSWESCCSREMREWVQQNGQFVSLDRHCESVTFLQESATEAGRPARPLDLRQRVEVPESPPEDWDAELAHDQSHCCHITDHQV